MKKSGFPDFFLYKYGKFAKYLTNFANKETHSVLYVRDFINVLLDYGRKESNRKEGSCKEDCY